MLLSRLRYYLASLPPLLVGIRNWPVVLATFLHLPIRKPVVVEVRSNGNRYHVCTPLDIWVIKETCIDRDYEQASVYLQDGWTILDIGAGLGDFTIHAARLSRRNVVYAYEPAPASFGLLQANMALNQVDNVQAFPYAVGGERDDVLTLHISTEAVQHSTAAQPGSATTKRIDVPSKSLDQIFEELRLEQCDFLKMDCEGAEYEILFHTSAATLGRIRHICLEYHDGITAYSHADLVRFFQSKGFHVTLRANPAHHCLGLLYAAQPDSATSI